MPSRKRRGHRSKGPPATSDEPPTGTANSKPSSKPQLKPPLTHFLCIPLVNDTSQPVLTASLRRFREEASSLVRAKAEEADIEDASRGAKVDTERLLEVLEKDERAVRPVGTLHLTLGVMSLSAEQTASTDAGQKEEGDGSTQDVDAKPKTLSNAQALLESLDVTPLIAGPTPSTRASEEADANAASTAQPSSPPPLSVILKGLRSMHAPAKTSFLYTSPTDATDRLQPFCQTLKDAFVEKGLMLDEKRKGKLKLHATVLNTIYARPGGRRGKCSDATAKDAVPQSSQEHQTPQSDAGGDSVEQVKEETVSVDHGGNDEQPQHGDARSSTDTGAAECPEPQPQQELAKRKPRRNRGPLRFDSRPLLEHFENFDWIADLQLDRIAICKMGAAKVKDEEGKVVDEAYEEVAVRKLGA